MNKIYINNIFTLISAILLSASLMCCVKQEFENKEISEKPIQKTRSENSEISEIYSECINGDTTIEVEGSMVRIITEYSNINDLAMPSQREMKTIDTETIENFKKPNNQIPIEKVPLKLKTKYVYFDLNLKNGTNFQWASFSNKYIKYHYTFQFSKIGINEKRTQALVYRGIGGFDERIESGETILLLKINGNWKFEKIVGRWTI